LSGDANGEIATDEEVADDRGFVTAEFVPPLPGSAKSYLMHPQLRTLAEVRGGCAQVDCGQFLCVYKLWSQSGGGMRAIEGGCGDGVRFWWGGLFVVEGVETRPSGVVIWLAEVALRPIPSWPATECSSTREAWWKEADTRIEEMRARVTALVGPKKVAQRPFATSGDIEATIERADKGQYGARRMLAAVRAITSELGSIAPA
jgi:hypothetical protein